MTASAERVANLGCEWFVSNGEPLLDQDRRLHQELDSVPGERGLFPGRILMGQIQELARPLTWRKPLGLAHRA